MEDFIDINVLLDVDLVVCTKCGAIVARKLIDTHKKWHRVLNNAEDDPLDHSDG